MSKIPKIPVQIDRRSGSVSLLTEYRLTHRNCVRGKFLFDLYDAILFVKQKSKGKHKFHYLLEGKMVSNLRQTFPNKVHFRYYILFLPKPCLLTHF